MKNIIFICVLFFSFFFGNAQNKNEQTKTEEKVYTPIIVAKLPEGKSYFYKNYCLNFEKVVEDSRCPSDVTCVWQGEAKIKMSLDKNEELVEEKIIVLTNPEGEGATFTLGKETFKIYGLKPYPTTALKNSGDLNYYLQLEVLEQEN
ncbi:hypothetical protein [Mesonia maritima]|uniref:Uncharacterized protein n=1 Tax=Mesonia maritima TaxID=1793873 RepID=A0ABU1K3R3_9FLAO|nr:hypothetical protein [Mesonia maritima]MDR6299890.1 hypothetical protein [Mesonia maritima]